MTLEQELIQVANSLKDANIDMERQIRINERKIHMCKELMEFVKDEGDDISKFG